MKVNKIANFINHSEKAQKVLKSINKNPAVYGSIASFATASILRPSLIGITPFKEKKDKQYSQASAVAAGTIELLAGCMLFIPLNKSIEKSSKNLYKTAGTIYHENPAVLRSYKSITNRIFKMVSLVPISLLRFSLVRPIVDFAFGKEKHESK